jgi:hypothetical protein
MMNNGTLHMLLSVPDIVHRLSSLSQLRKDTSLRMSTGSLSPHHYLCVCVRSPHSLTTGPSLGMG